jgi:hypothetical protein
MFIYMIPNFAQIRQEIEKLVIHLFNVIREDACHCIGFHETRGVLILYLLQRIS